MDALFSTGFIFVLVESICPGRVHGRLGVQYTCDILQYLVDLGNQAAARRLKVIKQACKLLSLHLRQHQSELGETTNPHSIQEPSSTELNTPFTFFEQITQPHQTYYANHGRQTTSDINRPSSAPNAQVGGSQHDPLLSQALTFDEIDLSNISLGGENDLYWVYHTSDITTGVDHFDWEAVCPTNPPAISPEHHLSDRSHVQL